MRKLSIILVLTLVLGGLPLVVSASVPAPEGPFDTAFRVQNLGASDATCTFSFYDALGNPAFTSSGLAPIAPGDSLYVYVPSDTTVADGQYSGVVSCDQEVAAVVNVGDADSGASYSGVSGSEVASTLYAPGIYDNYYGFFSNVVVQNATSDPIDITLEIYEPGNTTAVYSNQETAVPGNAYVSWEQEGLTQLVNNQFYSAKIIGTGDIAAIVNIYGGVGTANEDTLFSYNTFAAGSTTAYAPVIMNAYYGYDTALVVQNMGSATANVTITYSDAGTTSDWTGTIAPGAAISHYTPVFNVPAGALVGAKIVSTNSQPLAVIVNEQTVYNRAGTYTGFAAGSTGASAPVVMKGYYLWNSSITCQNVGSAAATMTIQYAGVSGTYSPVGGGTVPVDGVGLFYQPADITAADWIGSATISSDQAVVCVVNQDQNLAPQNTQTMDQLYAYNAIVTD